MLTSLQEIEHYVVSAIDGEIGHVVDVLFDDEQWAVRYVVVATDELLGARHVLLSARSFRQVEWSTRRLDVALTVDDVRHSPPIGTDEPVSRQRKHQQARRHPLPYYWNPRSAVGLELYPTVGPRALPESQLPVDRGDAGDAHLRSCRHVRNYDVIGGDDRLGRVEDFIADGTSWAIRYLVVDTSHWWFGQKVLIAPIWVSRISWSDRTVQIPMGRQAIEHSPKWDGSPYVDDAYASQLEDYFRTALPRRRDSHRATDSSQGTERGGTLRDAPDHEDTA